MKNLVFLSFLFTAQFCFSQEEQPLSRLDCQRQFKSFVGKLGANLTKVQIKNLCISKAAANLTHCINTGLVTYGFTVSKDYTSCNTLKVKAVSTACIRRSISAPSFMKNSGAITVNTETISCIENTKAKATILNNQTIPVF